MKTIITPIKGDHEAYAFRQNGFQGVIYIEKDSRAIIWPGKYDAKEFVTRVDQTVVPYREAQRFVIQIPDHEGFDFIHRGSSKGIGLIWILCLRRKKLYSCEWMLKI